MGINLAKAIKFFYSVLWGFFRFVLTFYLQAPVKTLLSEL